MFKRFTRAVFRDLGMKAVALVIAVLLWHYANTKVRDEVYIDVPLDVRVPNEYIKLRQNPKTILLLVRGPQELITSLRTRPARMGLRLEHAIASADLDERGHVALPVDPRRWNWQNLHDRDLA
ncbi:MAG: hypothetical protein QGI33_01705, partial [Candidatus Brocadiia bacterium]|nr:hypothetical protein [Candidatus Brocadiia bacterium]